MKNKLIREFGKYTELKIFIHADILRGFKTPSLQRNAILDFHFNELNSLHENTTIWMPTFNYDFCKGENYNVATAKSQVGVLSEHFRKNVANWRTSVPVFSVAGIGLTPTIKKASLIDPFDENSVFDILNKDNFVLLHYGSSLASSTILHYVERISNKLFYRYDKIFEGSVTELNGITSKLSFKYHVRPFGKKLEYDWKKIERDLVSENILIKLQEGDTNIIYCKIESLVSFWLDKLNVDPFYLLDEDSKKWILPMLDSLGRPFLITDFE